LYSCQVIDAANEVIDNIDKDELAKYFSMKSESEDEDAAVCIYFISYRFHPFFQSWTADHFKLLNYRHAYSIC